MTRSKSDFPVLDIKAAHSVLSRGEDLRRPLSKTALAAKNIRALLKAWYPHVKFSVTSETFSMGSAVRVKWTHWPDLDEPRPDLQQLVGALSIFEQGRFSGLDDSYKYDQSPKGQQFRDQYGSTKYLDISSFSLSPEELAKYRAERLANVMKDTASRRPGKRLRI